VEIQRKPGIKDVRSFFHKTSTIFAAIVIPVELIISILVYKYVMGAPSHFMGNNPANNPLSGDYLGMIYKGGVTIPVLMTFFLVVITFFVERLWTLRKARGKTNPLEFVSNLKEHVSSFSIIAAKKECDLQQGSMANVIRAGLERYQELEKHKELDMDKKTLGLQKEFEEATEMEMPILERNLVILSTIASIATLTGLLGTVLGMVKAFAALAHEGAPDAIGLAKGISEALMSTALGIGISMLTIVLYNYLTTRIDNLMYLTAETGQMIVRTLTHHHSDE
jgi:biopolymer transport protein ExbB